MPAVHRTRLIEALWKVHRWIYRRSGGRLGGRVLGMPVLYLTTAGRRSGTTRTAALHYLPDGDRSTNAGRAGRSLSSSCSRSPIMISALSHEDDIWIVQDFLTGKDEVILQEVSGVQR